MDIELLYSKFYQCLKEQKFSEAKSVIYEAHREGMPAGHILVKLVNRAFDNLQKSVTPSATDTPMSEPVPPINFAELPQKYFQFLINGQRSALQKFIDELLSKNISAADILLKVITPAMDIIGNLQSRQEISLSQIFISAKLTDEILSKLLPMLPARPMGLGKVIIGNLLGDHHSLGRKIVATFLRFYGFDVIDLGDNVPNEKFVETAIRENCQLIFVSAFLLHTAKNAIDLKAMLSAKGLHQVKIVAGGAPFNFDRQLYQQLHCDAYAPEGLAAVKVAKQLLGIA